MSKLIYECSAGKQTLSKEEEFQNISLKLKELKNIIKGGQKKDNNKNKILEYILYPELINFKELKNKIFILFKVKNDEELYKLLLEIINELFEKKQNEKNSPEEISLRGHFYQILEKLNYFICCSLIYLPNYNENNNKAFEYFVKWIISDNTITKSILLSYINIFNVEDLLFNFYSIKRDILFSISDINRILYLISILKMHNIYSFKYVIKKKNKLYLDQNLFIELFRTYNRTLNEIYDLTKYLISLNTSWAEPSIIEKIFNDKDIINKLDNSIKILLIEKLMINYSLLKENGKMKEKEILTYYRILSKYLNIISKNYFIDWSVLNKIFKNLIENKEYDKCINFINNIEDTNIINKYIDLKLIEILIKSIPIGKIILISRFIKSNKNIINDLLNNNRSKEGIKLIKALKLDKNEYDDLFDEISMNNFFTYKINNCINDSFDILLDYALIDELSFNKVFYKLMKKSYQETFKDNNNENETYNVSNDSWLPLNEEEDNQNEKNINQKVGGNKTFAFLNSFFQKEYFKQIKKDDNKIKKNILTQVDKDKILTLFYFAKIKNYNLSSNNQKLFSKIFGDILITDIDYEKYIPEDKYEPHDLTCLSVNIKSQKIVFIDNVESLNENYIFFKKSKFVGVDSEWRQSFYANNKEKASILQLSNYSGKNIMIIDLIKMEKDKNFFDLFEKYFKDKSFIGYSFNNSDIEQFNERLQKMFKECTIIDLIDIYQHKFWEKAPSLKDLCLKFLGKKLCKYEQCSNWENRPLRKRQLHYAALDALVCVSLYKKMTNNE